MPRTIRDVDNLLKSIMDGIQKAGMIHNDGQICGVSILKQWSVVGQVAVIMRW